MLVENWYYAFLMALRSAGLKWQILPCNTKENKSDNDGTGIYLNFLHLDDETIVMPVFRLPEDEAAARILKSLYSKTIIPIQANELAREGGIINCISWTK